MFGLRLTSGTKLREWFLRLTALEDEPAVNDHALQLRVELFNEDLTLLSDINVQVRTGLLHGAFAGCKASKSGSKVKEGGTSAGSGSLQELLSASSTPEARAGFAVGSILDVIQETPQLLSILREAVNMPPVWALVSGVRVSQQIWLERSILDAAPTSSPSYRFPLLMAVNGHPSLLCEVTACSPAPPLRVCGGFVRVVAVNPEDAQIRFVMTMLAARQAGQSAGS